MYYAEITEGICTNITVCEDVAFAIDMKWVELPEGMGIGDKFNGNVWEKTIPQPPERQIIPPTNDEIILARLDYLTMLVEPVEVV